MCACVRACVCVCFKTMLCFYFIFIYFFIRYDFVLRASQPVDNYWIRARGLADCGEAFKHAKTNAILRYQGAPLQKPTWPANGPMLRSHSHEEKVLVF